MYNFLSENGPVSVMTPNVIYLLWSIRWGVHKDMANAF